jgi:hypothetical protein
MDFLEFTDVSFLPNSSIGKLCEDLNSTVGQGIWYDTFQVQNTKWLWLVNDIFMTMNSDNMLCGCFGLYPNYVAGILNSVIEINFYVFCNKRKLRFVSYIEKCVAGKECTFMLRTDNYFVLTSGKEEVIMEFHSRFFGGKLPSELIFTQSVLKNIMLSSMAYGVVCINKRLTYIANDTLTSRHECVFHTCAFDLNVPRRLANFKEDISFCNKNRPIDIFPAEVLFCTKRSHNRSKNNQCQYTLCVKTGPASLKSLCVNKLWSLRSKYHKQKL